ncbi:MBL fold metallo-hydrolase [Bacillus sp. 03113]|uniref:MBL fold metallo-hydrolase n=1 Tax=Bacillus sp. 03113 TaxID=2578211 RepID=UPI001141D33B|nr:MBL fold metallo-hydrolase [Bacillus sp. 03113]
MKLTVIGPWGGYPKANEASAGYLLEHDGYHLLVDCGSSVLSKMQNILPPEKLNGVILSHYHADHIADIGVLQHARLILGLLGREQETLPIYGHNEDLEEFSKLTFQSATKGIAFDPQKGLDLGPFKISFLRTNHPAICYAMRIEAEGKSIVYTGDTSFKEELIPFSMEADLLLCECNFYHNQDGKAAGHMTSTEAGYLAQKAKVKNLILTHLPHFGNIEQLINEASIEYDGPLSLAAYHKTVIL